MSIPPLFKNFGKATKDLFKKKYEFDHSLKTIHKQTKDNDCTLESGVVSSSGSGELRGYVKTSGLCPITRAAQVDAELHTDAGQESKITLKKTFPGLGGEGASVTATAGLSSKDKDKAFKKPVASLEVEYTRPNVAVYDVLKTDLDNKRLEIGLSVGKGCLAVGGSTVLDLNGGAPIDSNAGVQASKGSHTVTAFTESNFGVVTGSYHVQRNAQHTIGTSIKFDLHKNINSFTVGGSYKYNADTTLSGKLELDSSNRGSALYSKVVEHQLSNPNVKLTLATQFRLSPGSNDAVQAVKFGVGAQLGDF